MFPSFKITFIVYPFLVANAKLIIDYPNQDFDTGHNQHVYSLAHSGGISSTLDNNLPKLTAFRQVMVLESWSQVRTKKYTIMPAMKVSNRCSITIPHVTSITSGNEQESTYGQTSFSRDIVGQHLFPNKRGINWR